jgi:bifunctional non-homologous end joining protein LigD
MSLQQYRAKRDFKTTSEPAGKVAKSRVQKLAFVIQKHAASHLHYDFRLEWAGTLKSWAVPKGPSLDPAVKRLAMEVEDHPIEYGKFEGTIPAGEYGGGTVMLWDRGTWHPEGDAEEGLKNGRLKFRLDGEKLQGEWMLVRSKGGYAGGRSAKNAWLLFKLDDDAARPEKKGVITEELPLSVSTQRDLDEIAAGKKVWHSKKTTAKKSTAKKKVPAKKSATKKSAVKKTATKKASPRKTASARKTRSEAATLLRKVTPPRTSNHASKLSERIDPQLPTLVDEVPQGDQWVHELKFDGYRMICEIDDPRVRFWTRNHLDWSERMNALVAAVGKLNLRQTILDGEVVAIDTEGKSDFQSLQNAFEEGSSQQLVYMVFDLLFHEGVDLRQLPLEERKARLEKLGLSTDRGRVRYAEHLAGDGRAFLKTMVAAGLEGIISKRRDLPYRSGRSTDWVKIKTLQTAEFVIGGYTDRSNGANDFGAMLVGFHEHGKLVYAGKVGTGFDTKLRAELLKQFHPLEQARSAFEVMPVSLSSQGVHWLQPQLIAQLKFTGWTRDQQLRHPVFQGLREDKPARSVTREKAQPMPAKKSASRPAAKTPAIKKAALKKATRNKSELLPSAKKITATKSSATKSKSAKDETSLLGVRLTHPNKLLFPTEQINKLMLAEYYDAVAERMLPYMKNRLLSIMRCPDGVDGEHFFQKHLGQGMPAVLHELPVKEKDGTDDYFYIKDAAGLVALTQISALEIHPWNSHVQHLETPDQFILDLDPDPAVKWPRVMEAAREIRDFLSELGLKSFLKTSGGKGLHLVVPLKRNHSWDEVDQFSRAIADAIVTASPQHYIATMSKKARAGKIFIDYLRNKRGATSVAPYSIRARAGAPVSMPCDWKELPKLTSGSQFDMQLAIRRAGKADPWAAMADTKQSITKVMLKTLGLS